MQQRSNVWTVRTTQKDMVPQTETAQHTSKKKVSFTNASQRTNTDSSPPTTHAHGNYWTNQKATQMTRNAHGNKVQTGQQQPEMHRQMKHSQTIGRQYGTAEDNPWKKSKTKIGSNMSNTKTGKDMKHFTGTHCRWGEHKTTEEGQKRTTLVHTYYLWHMVHHNGE